MGKSVLTGLLAGTAFSTLVAAGVSLMLPPPRLAGPVSGVSPVVPAPASAPAPAPASGPMPPTSAPQGAAVGEVAVAPAPAGLPAASAMPAGPSETAAMPPAPADAVAGSAEATAPGVPAQAEARPSDGRPAVAPESVAVTPAPSATTPATLQPSPAPESTSVQPATDTAPGSPPSGSGFAEGQTGLAPDEPRTEVPPAAPAAAPLTAAPSAAGPAPADTAPSAPQALAMPDTSAAPAEPAAPQPGTAPASPAVLPAPAAAEAVAPPAEVGATADAAPKPATPPPAPAASVTAALPDSVAMPTLPSTTPVQPAAREGTGEVPAQPLSPVAPIVVVEPPSPPVGAAPVPKPGFNRVVPGVRVDRLPRIGSTTPEEPAIPAAPKAGTDPSPAPEVAQTPPIEAFAARFENPDNLPVLAVLLFDRDGADPQALAALGQPLTVAIDPTADDATARAASFRAQGYEVAVLAPAMPAGSTASDVEVGFQGWLSALPEAVAVLAAPDLGQQANRRATQHLVALARDAGIGVAGYARGLDATAQVAQSDSVPHAEIWKVLGDPPAGPDPLRRALDRAAFEAERTGQVVVAMPDDAQTLAALAAWAGEGAGQRIRLAPLTAAMRAAP